MSQPQNPQTEMTWTLDTTLEKLVNWCRTTISQTILYIFSASLLHIVVLDSAIHSMEGTPWEHTTFTLSASATNLSASATNLSSSIPFPSSFGLTFNDTTTHQPGLSITREVFDTAKLCATSSACVATMLAMWAAYEFYSRHILPAHVVARVNSLPPSFERQLRSLNLVSGLFCVISGLLIVYCNAAYAVAGKDNAGGPLCGWFNIAAGVALAYFVHYRPTCDAVRDGAMNQSQDENEISFSGNASGQSAASDAESDAVKSMIDIDLFRVEPQN